MIDDTLIVPTQCCHTEEVRAGIVIKNIVHDMKFNRISTIFRVVYSINALAESLWTGRNTCSRPEILEKSSNVGLGIIQ